MPTDRPYVQRDSLDPHEWEGTEPRPPGERARSSASAMIVAFLILVAIVVLVVAF